MELITCDDRLPVRSEAIRADHGSPGRPAPIGQGVLLRGDDPQPHDHVNKHHWTPVVCYGHAYMASPVCQVLLPGGRLRGKCLHALSGGDRVLVRPVPSNTLSHEEHFDHRRRPRHPGQHR